MKTEQCGACGDEYPVGVLVDDLCPACQRGDNDGEPITSLDVCPLRPGARV